MGSLRKTLLVESPLGMDQHFDKRSLLAPGREYPSVAERRSAWQSFAEESGPFRAAFENAAIGMAIVDLDGCFLQVNPALLQIVGFDEDELLATDFQSITHPDDLESDVALARQLMAGRIEHYHMEKRYIHKQGHVVWVLLSASVARDSSGRVCFAISQIQDISDRKRFEWEATRQLRHIDRLTNSVRSILQAVDRRSGRDLYRAIAQTVMESLESPLGLILLRTGNETLSGYMAAPGEFREPKLMLSGCIEPWKKVLTDGAVVVDTEAHAIDSDLLAERSLIVPIRYEETTLGLFHVANAAEDYDDDDRDLLVRVTAIIGPALHARMQRDKLTPREAEVMDLIVAGMSQKQIATTLNISIQTTAKHRARVLDKLHLQSDVELVRLALKMKPSWAEGGSVAAVSPLSAEVPRPQSRRISE